MVDHRGIVGSNVRRLRKARGFTQEGLAAAGLSSVKMVESGKRRPRMATLQAIAKALDVHMQDLFSDPERPVSQPLMQFLESPIARDVTEDEVDALRDLVIPGREFTPEAYHLALLMFRATTGTDETVT